MIVYKTVDQFDRNTREKVGTWKVFDFSICDFTGEPIEDGTNPNTYNVDYQSNDPCAGSGEGERWLYAWEKEKYGEEEYDNMDGYSWEIFMQSNYIFQTTWDGVEIFGEMIKKALTEMKDGIYSLDHLLRWSRGQMLERVLKEGKYMIEQFLSE